MALPVLMQAGSGSAIESIAQHVGSYIRGTYILNGAYRDAGVSAAEKSATAFEQQIEQRSIWLQGEGLKAWNGANLQAMARFMDSCGGFAALEKAVGNRQPQDATLQDELSSLFVGQDVLVSHAWQVLLGAAVLFENGQLTAACR